MSRIWTWVFLALQSCLLPPPHIVPSYILDIVFILKNLGLDLRFIHEIYLTNLAPTVPRQDGRAGKSFRKPVRWKQGEAPDREGSNTWWYTQQSGGGLTTLMDIYVYLSTIFIYKLLFFFSIVHFNKNINQNRDGKNTVGSKQRCLKKKVLFSVSWVRWNFKFYFCLWCVPAGV